MALSMITYGAVVILFSFCKESRAQPVFKYDGVSVYDIVGQFNWTLKYEVGKKCEDPTWIQTLDIDIESRSTQADLILAFGTSSTYFAFVLAYDGAVMVPQKENPYNEPHRRAALFVTPASGKPLREATTTLEAQYAESNDFRESLIEFESQTENWEKLTEKDSAMSDPGRGLNLKIISDRRVDRTELTIWKNGENATIAMGSTWNENPWERESIYLFMGCDKGNGETFRIYGVQSTVECDVIGLPTPPTTSIPTMNTLDPSVAPTKVPTGDPSMAPTLYPTEGTANPSAAPTLTGETKSPTEYPTESTEYPTVDTMSPSVITLAPSISPTISPTDVTKTSTSEYVVVTEANVAKETQDDGSDEGDPLQKEVALGLTTMHWMIIGGIIAVVIVCILLAICFYCYKIRKEHERLDDDYEDDYL